jgi:hypothetical protein
VPFNFCIPIFLKAGKCSAGRKDQKETDPMPSRHVRVALLNALVLLLCVCAACATRKSATQAEQPKEELSAEEKSRQEWDERVTDSSWLVSGEYFSQKDHSNAVNLNEWFKGRKELEAKQEDTEERLAKLEKAVGEGQAISPTQGRSETLQVAAAEPVPAPTVPPRTPFLQTPRLKVALVILPEVYQAAADMKGPLLEAVRHQFVQRTQLLLVGPQAVEDILIQQGLVVTPANTADIARALGIYPAARLVLFLDKLALLHEAVGVKGRLDYTIVDGFSGGSVTRGEETASASSDPDGESRLLEDLMGRVALALGKRATQYIWLSRVAMVEDKRIYLSAGEASGLKPGDVLAVYGPGREIIHPIAKVSMGFQPGPYKGKIKVVKLFGKDAAEALLVAGEGKIEGNDLVGLPDELN